MVTIIKIGGWFTGPYMHASDHSTAASRAEALTDRQLKAPTPSPPPPNGDFQFGRVVVSVAAGDSFFGEGWCAELGIVY